MEVRWDSDKTMKYSACLVFIHNKHKLFGITKEEDMQFDVSWDWLMIVVRRCQETAQYLDAMDKFYPLDYFHIDLIHFLSADFDSVYDRCISFITWYNQQPK